MQSECETLSKQNGSILQWYEWLHKVQQTICGWVGVCVCVYIYNKTQSYFNLGRRGNFVELLWNNLLILSNFKAAQNAAWNVKHSFEGIRTWECGWSVAQQLMQMIIHIHQMAELLINSPDGSGQCLSNPPIKLISIQTNSFRYASDTSWFIVELSVLTLHIGIYFIHSFICSVGIFLPDYDNSAAVSSPLPCTRYSHWHLL